MKLVLLLFALVLFSGCFYKDRDYYDQHRNPNLNYSYDFNESISSGYTFNSTYFQFKRHNVFETLFERFSDKINFKHEEGHIYHNQLLNIDDLDVFESNMFKKLNLTDHHSYRQYIISVSEGIADHYTINYFNNEDSDKYLAYLRKNKDNNVDGQKQHYEGLLFVNHSLISGLYINFDELILDLGSIRQYELFNDYLNSSYNA